MSIDEKRYEEILTAARERLPSSNVDTMVVAGHLAQMRLFMVRQGVEWYARQDSFSMRREFLRRVVEFNDLPSRMEAIIDSHLTIGHGLLYFRPVKDLYKIHYFTHDQFQAFYDENGELEEICIIYSFRVKPKSGGAGFAEVNNVKHLGIRQQDAGEERWVKIRVRADRMHQQETVQKPAFDSVIADRTADWATNSLGFVPAVEVFNNRGLAPGSFSGEFDWVASYVLQHDRMMRHIRNNLSFFGSPTLVTGRPLHDVIEADGSNLAPRRATVSTNSGFGSASTPSTRTLEGGMLPWSGGGMRVPRVIANADPSERNGYITPDPVSGDLLQYAGQYQETIRAALGGVDDLSVSAGATAYEVRTLYGRVAATANRKCRDLFENGFCRIFSMMIAQEEVLFRESLAWSSGLVKPEPPLYEDFPDQESYLKAKTKYDKAVSEWSAAAGDAVRMVKSGEGQIGPEVVGLIPDGDTKVDWRHTGEIFEDSPQELLQRSIVTRNLQEQGVSSIEAMQFLFPNKTPEERMAMLSGYPFRVVEATQRSIGIFLDTIRGTFQVPHPQEPDLPLAADPNLDLVPYVYKALEYLRRELSYSGTYSDVDSSATPTPISDADRLRASRGLTTSMERERTARRVGGAGFGPNAGLSEPGGTAGFPGSLGFTGAGSGWQPMAGGVSSARRISDTELSLPGAGGVLAFDPANPFPGSGRELGATGSQSVRGDGADLFVGTNPIPGFGANSGPVSGPAGRSGRGSGAKRRSAK